MEMKNDKRPTLENEQSLWQKGYNFVIGTDEVGRGAFAGPVVVAAVVFKKDSDHTYLCQLGINDSKLLKPKTRELLANEIKKYSIWSVAEINVPIINMIGIGKATSMAFRKVIRLTQEKLGRGNYFLLIDGFQIKHIPHIGLTKQKAIIKGDQKSISIAAASIVAKVHRDKLMTNLHLLYPFYNFAKHKGYGTKDHQIAMRKHGLCAIHRTSFNLSSFLPLAL